ncbi:sensor histidine kinase [Microbacter margulisiae]|uniref:Sensor histidine kinase YesM n=1 Tax=Microbacter margulisiae TaxID=1350067 RepID=A0A7W5H0B4_9PORP|nr:histidine kinase [Microbacter margulisiae]MBB3186378.1 sensor histidine kinase YesM [Microbacter margulisiae]
MKLTIRHRELFEGVVHICFWIIFLSLPALLPKPQPHLMPFGSRPPFPFDHVTFLPMYVVLGMEMAYFYLNYCLFIHLFRNRRYVLFVLANLVTMVIILAIKHINDPHQDIGMLLFRDMSPFIFLFLAGTSLQMIKDQIKMRNEVLENELTFLRNQISPHFLFNILNMVNSFARSKPELIEPTVDKLSNLIRYMLYNTEQQVPLSEEVEHLKEYIELQKTRYNDRITIVSYISDPLPDCHIEPMLLIPLVENAFKHGTALIDAPEIHISLDRTPGTISFCVTNRFNKDSHENTSTYSGIGLKNIKRRLELLYPGKHTFDAFADKEWYHIQLTITL